MAESITITDNRTGESIEIPIDERGRLRAEVVQAPARGLVLRPGLHVDGGLRERHHLPRRRRRHPALPGLSDRAAGRELHLPRGGLPPVERRAAQRPSSIDVWDHEITLPHLHPRERTQAVPRGLPLRRPPDGDAGLGRRRPVDLLPRRQGHLRPRVPQQADHPPHRQDADPGRRRPPLQRGHALRLPRQLARLHLELPVDDVEGRRAPLRGRPGAGPGPRRPVHPPRRPRAELLDHGHAGGRLLPCRPVLGDRRRRRRPLRPAPRRRQRGGHPHADRDRLHRERDPTSSPRSRRARADGSRASATGSTRATTPGPRSSSGPPTRCSRSPARTRCSTSPSSSRRSPSPTSTSPPGKLYPNVDFYSGLIYQAMGFPLEMFPVLFAIPRTVGWLAHWQEMLDQDSKIARPRQLYIGADARDYVPDRRAADRRPPAVAAAVPGLGTRRIRPSWTMETHRSPVPGEQEAPGQAPAPDGDRGSPCRRAATRRPGTAGGTTCSGPGWPP